MLRILIPYEKNATMKNYFFLRHFETVHTRNHIISGRDIQLPVLESSPIYTGIPIDAIFCSTALRCRQTASAFSMCQPKCIILYNDLLLERDLGVLQGKSRKIAAVEYADLFEGDRLNVFSTPPKGESYAHFKERVAKAKDWINDNSGNFNNILICSHNQFLKMLFYTLRGEIINGTEWHKLNFPCGTIVSIDLN